MSGNKKQAVSAGSFFDLKAELAKREDAFSKSKSMGKGKAEPIVGGIKRPDKKPTTWARPNKGVHARAQRDIELEQVSRPTLESARAALERKAEIYDKLQKGKGAGLNEKQRESLLVDFDSRDDGDDSDESLDRDESLIVPAPYTSGDDPIVEYEDEFGRIRTARRSEVPRDRLPENNITQVPDDDDPDVIYGRATHFPVYEPTAAQRAAVEESLVETSPFARYDASKENRATGAAFYQFSADEETRQRQMAELKRARDDTVQVRGDLNADLVPHAQANPESSSVARGTSRALEKRKQELDDRRAMLEAKRRKMLGHSMEPSADDFLASLEKDLITAPAGAA